MLAVLVPELEASKGIEQSDNHHKDVFGHVMEVIEYTCDLVRDPEPVFRSLAPRVREHLDVPLADDLTRGEALIFAAVFHDMAKPATYRTNPEGSITFIGHDRLGAEMVTAWCEKHATSRRLERFLSGCVLHHLALGFLVRDRPLSLRQMDRYLRRVDPLQVELGVLTAADRLAARGPRARQSAIDGHLGLAREMTRVHFDQVDAGPIVLPLDGAELSAALDISPGPWLKDLLIALREQTLVKKDLTADQAVGFAKSWVLQAGVGPNDHRRTQGRASLVRLIAVMCTRRDLGNNHGG